MSFLVTGPDSAEAPVFLFAHGAGAPMDSDFMNAIADGLAEQGVRVLRFEFPYMAKRRDDGKKRGPDRAPVLIDTFQQMISSAGGAEHVFIGGKSMGGRYATMVGADMPVRGVCVFGYPFHAPGKPDKPRVEHMGSYPTPTLILQGTRDPFGKPEEVAGYDLDSAITLTWLEDGDHDLKPRVKSGRTREQNWQEAITAAAAFMHQQTQNPAP